MKSILNCLKRQAADPIILTERSRVMDILTKELSLCEVPYNSKRYQQMLIFRNMHMRVPIGLSLFEEDLSGEVNDHHIGVYRKDELIGVCIITPVSGTTARMRQVVIAPEYRNRGIGRTMMLFAEERTAALGLSRLILDSRLSALRFYEKLGYRRVGLQFMEVGLPHYMMEKNIR